MDENILSPRFVFAILISNTATSLYLNVCVGIKAEERIIKNIQLSDGIFVSPLPSHFG